MKKIIFIAMMLAIVLGLSACNMDPFDGLTPGSNTFQYVLVKEGDEYYLHKIESWADSESDAFGITTSCCHNRIWTSFNAAVLYKEFPEYLKDVANMHICGEVTK